MSLRPYEGKLGIITGGSRGIGAATAQRLAAKGCNLVLAYASSSSTDAVNKLCRHLSEKNSIACSIVQADLATPTEASEAIILAAQNLFKTFASGKPFCVDILINNAGVSSNQHMNDGTLGPIDPKEFERVYTVNVLAPLLLTQAVASFLPQDRSGRIVSISSVSSSIGYQGQSVYAGSKGAIEAMTRVWSRELHDRATVNCINPGPAWGDMYEKAGPAFWKINQPYVDATPLASYNSEAYVLAMAGDDAQKFDTIVKGSMQGRRPGFTTEIAGTIDMLCSAEGGWTTGSVICANGGMRMSIA